MPNLMTHKIFGEDVLNLVDKEVLDIVNLDLQAFSVGTSGPDFLFYHSKFPWQNQVKGEKVRRIGSLVHERNINLWYKYAILACKNEKDAKLKNTMLSFLIGHLTHWALDSVTHPFIFYRSDGSNDETKYWHYRYESSLDSQMVVEYRKVSLKDYNSRKILKTNEHINLAIYRVYKDGVVNNYDSDFKLDYVKQAFKDSDNILKILYDPSGIKFKLVQLLETLINKKWLFSSHIVTSKVDKDHDILNLNRHLWKNPAKPSYTSQETFLELYMKALEIAVEVINELRLILDGKDDKQFFKLLDNKSYETGLSEYKEMVEYKSVY